MNHEQLNQELGNIDLYLLDQILKGRYKPHMRILDAGCGEGRNLVWFLKNDYPVYGIDKDPSAILMLQFMAKSLNPALPKEHFQQAAVEDMPFPPNAFDALISNAVLHFAQDEGHFMEMMAEMHRVLKPEGSLFIRMTSDFGGMAERAQEVGEGKYLLPDGSLRFLLTDTLLYNIQDEFGFQLAEPLKTVNVDNSRCMSTLILTKK